jgi:hypothetical protein
MAASAGAAPSVDTVDAVLNAVFPPASGLQNSLRRAVARWLLIGQLEGVSKSQFVPTSPPCTDTKAMAGVLPFAASSRQRQVHCCCF